ncbi:MAG: ABC transporter permease, partial [Pseudomonadota bacterium]
VGLESKFSIFKVQRSVNEERREPLQAVLPGVALQELWDLMGTAEKALITISVMVVVTGLLGMLIMLLAGLGERRREMAILRSVGARPVHIFVLLVGEAAALTLLGAALGLAVLYGGLAVAQPFILNTYGLFIALTPPSAGDLTLLAMIVGAGLVAGGIPAWKASRQALADGLVVRV